MLRVLAVSAILIAGGCGGNEHSSAPPPRYANPYPDDPALVERATTPGQRAALARAAHDVDAMKKAATATPKRSLKGTPALRKSTAHFLQEQKTSPLERLTQTG